MKILIEGERKKRKILDGNEKQNGKRERGRSSSAMGIEKVENFVLLSLLFRFDVAKGPPSLFHLLNLIPLCLFPMPCTTFISSLHIHIYIYLLFL